jgi:hypothetical protein
VLSLYSRQSSVKKNANKALAFVIFSLSLLSSANLMKQPLSPHENMPVLA